MFNLHSNTEDQSQEISEVESCQDSIQNCESLNDNENSRFEVDESEVIETANKAFAELRRTKIFKFIF